MIRALFKFAKLPTLVEGKKPMIVDTTSSQTVLRELSPFVLSAPPAKRFENLWQFSKVYSPEHLTPLGEPNMSWGVWRINGINDYKAHRYPMGKGRIPAYSFWNGEKLDYIQARKRIYVTEYAKNVIKTKSYEVLQQHYQDCLNDNRELILLDYDAYDHAQLGMSLIDVINNPKRKMGHAFVLIMMLTGMLEECIND